MPECFPSSKKAQHSNELRIYICHACLGSCTEHTWMSTTKGHLVLLQRKGSGTQNSHAWASQRAWHARSGRRGNRVCHLFSPQRKYHNHQQLQKSRLGTFHGKWLVPQTCLLHWEMSPANRSSWKRCVPMPQPPQLTAERICLQGNTRLRAAILIYLEEREVCWAHQQAKAWKTWAFLPGASAESGAGKGFTSLSFWRLLFSSPVPAEDERSKSQASAN